MWNCLKDEVIDGKGVVVVVRNVQYSKYGTGRRATNGTYTNVFCVQ